MPAAKEQIRKVIADNKFNRVADVYSLLKDSFKDIFQELMEAEPNASPGYEKDHKDGVPTVNKRNGHSPKLLRSSMRYSRSMPQGTVRVNSNQSLSPNTSRNYPALKIKRFPFMQGA